PNILADDDDDDDDDEVVLVVGAQKKASERASQDEPTREVTPDNHPGSRYTPILLDCDAPTVSSTSEKDSAPSVAPSTPRAKQGDPIPQRLSPARGGSSESLKNSSSSAFTPQLHQKPPAQPTAPPPAAGQPVAGPAPLAHTEPLAAAPASYSSTLVCADSALTMYASFPQPALLPAVRLTLSLVLPFLPQPPSPPAAGEVDGATKCAAAAIKMFQTAQPSDRDALELSVAVAITNAISSIDRG
ncbi:hypothetical protein TeGR_g8668, partial [Tetraparma gracilis]